MHARVLEPHARAATSRSFYWLFTPSLLVRHVHSVMAFRLKTVQDAHRNRSPGVLTMNRIMRDTLVPCRTFPLRWRLSAFAGLLTCLLLATAVSAGRGSWSSLSMGPHRGSCIYTWPALQLSLHQGLGLLQSRGITALRNLIVSPSLTAPSHIAIATGSTFPVQSPCTRSMR